MCCEPAGTAGGTLLAIEAPFVDCDRLSCHYADVPYQAFEASLMRLGLSDREAAVYITLLGLGPSSVLQISRKAKVARATTYLTLESLMKSGLVSTFQREKSALYVAAGPDRFRDLIKQRREDLNKEEELLKDLMPKLDAFIWSEDSRPTVVYYHGQEGLKTMRSEMLRMTRPGETWYNFSPVDHLVRVFGEDSYSYDRQRLARKIKSKTIFTTASAELKAKELAGTDPKRLQRRFVSPKRFTSGTGVSIFGNRVAMGIMEKRMGGIIIESESVATMMREFFNLAWDALE